MALPKVVGYVAVILVLFYSLVKQGYRPSSETLSQALSSTFSFHKNDGNLNTSLIDKNEVLQELTSTAPSHVHVRERRMATGNATDFDIQVVINIDNQEVLQLFLSTLSTLSTPIQINSTAEITSVETTTICTHIPEWDGYQCSCEPTFAWSYNTCLSYPACEADYIVGNTCGCIYLPTVSDMFCQANISQTEPVVSEVVVDVELSIYGLIPDLSSYLTGILSGVPLPLHLPSSVHVTNINLTTVCSPDANGTLQCQCQPYFALSCEMCDTDGACNGTTGEICGCTDHFPYYGQVCEPVSNITQCPDSNNVSTTTMTSTTMTSTTPVTPTTPMTSTTAVTPTPTSSTTSTTSVSTTPVSSTTVTSTTTMTSTPTSSTTMSTTSVSTTPMTSTTVTSTTTMTPTPTSSTTMSTTSVSTTPMTSTTVTSTTTMTPTPTSTSSTTMSTTSLSTTPVSTTPMSTTPVSSTTLTTMSTTTLSETTLAERTLSFTMDLTFDDSYNNNDNDVYKNAESVIAAQSESHITSLNRVEITRFRSGSTICDYTVTAPALPDPEIQALERGIFDQMSLTYTMIHDNTEVKTPNILFGQNWTMTCGPPPAEFNWTDFTAQWKLDGQSVKQDSNHQIFEINDVSVLNLSKAFNTDNGLYECRLINRENQMQVFRQKFTELRVSPNPVIHVNPVRRIVQCGNTEEERKTVDLECYVEGNNTVMFKDVEGAETGTKVTHQFQIPVCEVPEELSFTCQVTNSSSEAVITLVLTRDSFTCFNDSTYGDGRLDDIAEIPCPPNYAGKSTSVCRADGTWEPQQDSCILQPVQELLEQSENLNANSLPLFLDQLSNVTSNLSSQVVNSSATISAIVTILNNVANTSSLQSISINQILMEDILLTAGVLTSDAARESWDSINANDTKNVIETRNNIPVESVSSLFLQSIETLTGRLTNDSFNIVTPLISLNKTTFTDSFEADFTSSVEINVLESDGENKSITVISFDSMDNVLPPRDEANSSTTVINGRVVLVQSTGKINNISFTFDILSRNLSAPQCVFWNFTLFDGLGGWDDEGCELVNDGNESVTCRCNHLTSFSILMSPDPIDDKISRIITYVGVGISMASLVICLVIEAIIWKKIRRNNTSYLRHVSIVNIAVSLLIANIWFIIGARISNPENSNACSAATFFIHFFYLALFFWMLASALLLLYRTVSVFDGGLSRKSMMAIGFCLGYGAPVIIAIITIAVTAPNDEYIRKMGICWLNWDESKALLAFVLPALTIVVINFFILLLVIYKMLRRRAVGDAAQAAERHVLVVIARSLAVLTPVFGLTWALGVGVMVAPRNSGIRISFAFFNSLQGFFILVFGTLLDRKVREEITVKSQSSRTGNGTRTTSGGNFSSSALGIFRRLRKGRDGYNISSNNSGESNSFSST